jgi:hypothetical protein
MWWLLLTGCEDELTCPDGFKLVNKGCVPTEDTTPTTQDQPNLVVVPSFLDLGVIEMPCVGEGNVEVRNSGEGSLDVMDIEYESLNGDLSLDPATVPQLPYTLEPGEMFTLGFRLEGTVERADQGTLTIQTTDPRAPTTFQSSGVIEVHDERTETVVAPKPVVDIMLLVDTSATVVVDNLDDITLGIPAMLTALDETADWQLAVISSPNGCMNIPPVSDASFATALNVINNTFIYPQHLLSEALFAMGDAALSRLDGCNMGMLRPGAQLHFIVISDEPEQSGIPWQSWITDFQAYSATFVVSAVVDSSGACGYGADGYIEAVAATGGVTLDICNSSWGSQFSGVVDAIEAGVVAPIPLEAVPLEETIRVEVDGVPVDSFQYNAGANSIEDILPPPPPGSLIEITYGMPGECDA